MPPAVKNNLRWGVSYGLAFATVCSLIVLAQYVIAGPSVTASRGLSIGIVVGAYFAGGIVAGATVGLLRPLTKWRLGATFVGVVACLPAVLAFAVAFDGAPANWSGDSVAAVILTAVLLGGFAGYTSWTPSS